MSLRGALSDGATNENDELLDAGTLEVAEVAYIGSIRQYNRIGSIRDMNKIIKGLLFISILVHLTVADLDPNHPEIPTPIVPARKWTTLSGNQPLVIGRGGLSGLFPEGSPYAIEMGKVLSLPDWVVFCNLQMTKDNGGLCLTNIKLDNETNISQFDPHGQKTYNVNGKDLTAWLSVEYSLAILQENVSLIQSIYSRPAQYDGMFGIATPESILENNLSKFWLNVQYEAFYTKLGIQVVDYVLETLRNSKVDFLSSPEISFLKTISGKVNKVTTKVIFQFLHANDVEPTTGQTYGTILNDLAAIKLFASGIIVPKEYIWPIKPDRYLGLPTTLVADAHKLGLEVYASGFANDIFSSYNYSYDPSLEYLQFINNGDSVDGFITDSPPTASEAVACLANNNKPTKGPALVISRNGASGVYPACTDLAYQQAVDDGADIIDCSVQISKDGVAFCMDTADLMEDTNAMTKFLSLTANIPEIQPKNGIFSFDLTWSEIQSLKPQIVSPYAAGNFFRNPAYKNSGKFLTLPEFLEFAKAKAPTGILINIQNAAYLASKKNIDIVRSVKTALSNASLDNNPPKQVLIQSADTAVLAKFQDNPSYKKVYFIEQKKGSAPTQTVEEIKKYAQAVNLPKTSVIRVSDFFTTSMTNIAQQMKEANLAVFIHFLKNEYGALAFDYVADPLMEIATFTQLVKADGIVTEFPATANRYMWSACSHTGPTKEGVYEFSSVTPGDLASSINPDVKPVAEAPLPSLEVQDVVQPPLPEVMAPPGAAAPGAGAADADGAASPACTNVANLSLSLVAAILVFGGVL
ncbi:glycerophosphodiester phosphodiesterase GDPDL7-like [Senna tora]|uniref:glycerophosphodiester phosphodiesterase n=1 Tax=Senna tora TaxID=362788 RepID=A0A835CCQ1_9FABA|nr:glycerophosphodiester phosphodiesterase GDPDL7-like [Senna tora]